MKVKNSSLPVKSLPLAKVSEPSVDMRSSVNGQSVADLVESISAIGLINPILVRETDEGYEVVAGARRLRACRELKWSKVPAFVFPRKGIEAEMAKMHENLMRAEVTPIEEAEYLSALQSTYKLTGKQLAGKLNRAESYVSERLALLRAPAELRAALAEGKLSFSSARELARIRNQDVRQAYISHAIQTGINDATAKAWRVDANAAERAQADATPPEQAQRHDNVQHIKVQCALTGKTIRIENTVLVRIDKVAWETILADQLAE